MIKKSEIPDGWKHLNLRQKSLKVLKRRNWHNPRKDKYGSVVPPEQGANGKIYTSIAYGFEWADEAAAVFGGEKSGYAYPRLSRGTPPIHELSKKILELELGKNNPRKNEYDVLLAASGMSATVALTLTLLPFGGEFISSPYLYGGTYNWFSEFLPQLGRQCYFVKDPRDLDEWKRMIYYRPRASFLFWEEDPNPTPFKLDGAGIAKLARENGKLSFCDNTIPTPILNQPLLYGVDGVIESASKNIGGDSRGLGGSIAARSDIIKEIRDSWFVVLGSVMDSRVADYMLAGIKTLRRRMRTKIKNAKAIVDFLENCSAVKKVHWSGSDLLSFELWGSFEDAKRVVESFKFILLAPHLGDDYPLGIHPASTTHSKVPKEEREKLGISDTLIRLSVGLCDSRDVIDDLKQATDG